MTLQDALIAYKTYARAEGKSSKTVAWVAYVKSAMTVSYIFSPVCVLLADGYDDGSIGRKGRPLYYRG